MDSTSRDDGPRADSQRRGRRLAPTATASHPRRPRTRIGLSVVALTAAATGVAGGVDPALAVQQGNDSPALLEYFTFVPQALLLLLAVGVRRYVLADSDVPWWLDGAALRGRASALVPQPNWRVRDAVSGSTASDDEATAHHRAGSSDDTDQPADGDATPSTGSGSSPSGGTQQSSGATASTTTTATRGNGPVPGRLALGYGNQRVVVGDGDTVDEKLRAMLRGADEAEHAKWIDDGQLRFVRDEHGFTLIVGGDGLTRCNGERLRPGERTRIGPGDEIDLSGVMTLSVEVPRRPD
ncbi:MULTISPECIES: hypothetical protein [Halomicrobium]|uniref:FHA domain-containing protein n=2 Tax=Halomicrobium mukohataei TaxID=57705 RepID=C7P1L9_HALMD|nr:MULTISPECIES: hypothetical protein [Halomicrobium]ACV49109.1 hypothetical protein Hmuk_3004 [Halomicrobium mukohataei DSM 12286]QCD64523.1 hypothetical protein E5139_02290 [Halomicrobium mukohataei]QFR19329.1 hypothetical protein GBQ70_02290 [Halomicrobium sp. ZPS1]